MEAPSTISTARRLSIAALLLLVAAFCIVNAVNAVRKGGDFQGFLEAGRRVLTGAPLYAGSSPGSGVTWPPFLGLAFSPLAALDQLSPVATRLVWYSAGLVCLFFGVRYWARACLGDDARSGVVTLTSARVLVPLFFVLFPLQTNFEHQNLNPLLLFLLGAAALAISRQHPACGGLLVGAASALKAFPALLIIYLAYRRMWTAVVYAVAAAAGLTAVATLRYGRDAMTQLTAWWSLSDGGWPTRGNNQSLVAAVDRVVTGFQVPHEMLSENPLTPVVTALIALLMLIAFVASTWRRSVSNERIAREMAVVLLLAVLLSPIAWDHYWVLLYPAFLVAYDETHDSSGGRAVLWVAAILTSALTPFTIGRAAFDALRERSPQTIAAVIVFVLMVIAGSRALRLRRTGA